MLQNLPPVRNQAKKKTKKKRHLPTESDKDKPDVGSSRISSYDYRSWDKYDVVSLCNWMLLASYNLKKIYILIIYKVRCINQYVSARVIAKIICQRHEFLLFWFVLFLLFVFAKQIQKKKKKKKSIGSQRKHFQRISKGSQAHFFCDCKPPKVLFVICLFVCFI